MTAHMKLGQLTPISSSFLLLPQLIIRRILYYYCPSLFTSLPIAHYIIYIQLMLYLHSHILYSSPLPPSYIKYTYTVPVSIFFTKDHNFPMLLRILFITFSSPITFLRSTTFFEQTHLNYPLKIQSLYTYTTICV